jgi:small nuclear ribonucleoprotein (snRNP)-like protein
MDKKEIIRPSKKKTEDTMKMQPATPESDNMEFSDKQEQDRVTEKLSYSVPMAPLPPTPKLALGKYVGKSVRLRLRDGTVVIGDFDRQQWDFLYLSNVEEIGKDYRLTADWGAVDGDTVVGIYPAIAKAEKI